MAKGGNNQTSNGSRFSKPYDASNSFVKKVALRVSDYLGGWFGTTTKVADDSTTSEATPVTAAGDNKAAPLGLVHDYGAPAPRVCLDDLDTHEMPTKRMKPSSKGKYPIDFPISPIPSTSGLFQSNINHNFDIQSGDDYMSSSAGPSGLQSQRYTQSTDIDVQTPSTNAEVKANGATDDHSESSESTSGCSSLVPQSDRLSQSAYVSTSRKKSLEDKLNYARQLKQSRTSLYLNRSIPALSDHGNRRNPSFDISAYGSPIFDKSSVREKMVNSPFYTGQTSYGGASAYRRSKCTLYPQRNSSLIERKEGMQVHVKPSHHGSTEDLSNMSHTAKRILEALEQFSTPVNDAKRIPVNPNPPLGSKRKRFEDLSESRLRLSTPKTPLNPNAGPSISGLNVPTVPDLLKLKRLERIQNSTAAARQAAVPKEYTLPTDKSKDKHTGKIVCKLSKMKDKSKALLVEKPEEVDLPKIALPITTFPKFDIKLQQKTTPVVPKAEAPTVKRNFTFSPPIALPVPSKADRVSTSKNKFTFSNPLKPEEISNKQGASASAQVPAPMTTLASVTSSVSKTPLTELMSSEAFAKLKRKSSCDTSAKKPFEVEPAKELSTGSVMDVVGKKTDSDNKVENKPFGDQFKPSSNTWECETCLIRNLNDAKTCAACMNPRVSSQNPRTLVKVSNDVSVTVSQPIGVTGGFGNQFKPPAGSWTCKECFVNNNASSSKCVACESAKPSAGPAALVKDSSTEKPVQPPQPAFGFGDMFKKKSGQWECSVCMIQNKESDVKCAACETPKPGAKVDKPEPPSFNFGIPPGGGGFKFGIDKAGEVANPVKPQLNGPHSNFKVETPVGIFSFGIPPAKSSETKPEAKEEPAKLPTNKPSPVTSAKPPTKPLWAQKSPEKPSFDPSKASESLKPYGFDTSPGKNSLKHGFIFNSGDKTKPAKITKTNPPESNMPEVTIASKPNSVDSVSSSNANFTFGIPQPAATVAFVTSTSAPPLFQFKTSDSDVVNERKNKLLLTAFTPPAPTTTSTSFSKPFSTPMVNNTASKLSFGDNTNTGFGSGIKTENSLFGSASAPAFGNSTPSFGATSGFNGPSIPATLPAPASSAPAAKVATPAASTSIASIATNSFGSAATTAPSTTFNSPVLAFGSNRPSLFGATSTAVTTFGTSSTSVTTFGAPSTSVTTFGAPSTSVTTFGAPSTPATTFGAPSTPVTTFGAPSTPVTTFGAPSTPVTTFGAPSTPVTTFGAPSTPVTTFGAPSTPAATFGIPTPARVPASAAAPPRPAFGGFGTPVSNFASNPIASNPAPAPAPAPAFGSVFSVAPEKPAPASSTPFIFGGNSNNNGSTTTAAAVSAPAPAPGVFTFGASKPETKPPQFGSGFGASQNGQQPFSFGSPAPSTNIFGGFGQPPKSESHFGPVRPAFGSSATISFGQNNATPAFGQNSAPPTFSSAAPSFDFGSNASQQPAASQPFQFGTNTATAQPASAPAPAPSTGFNFNVPQSFNFTGGQTPTFSATPSAAPTPQRRVIKAVRRTQR